MEQENKMSDLLDYYLSDKGPGVPTYSKSRFKGKSSWITLSRCEEFVYILRLTLKTLLNIVKFPPGGDTWFLSDGYVRLKVGG